MFAKFESVAALAALAAIFADTAEAFWGKGHLLGKLTQPYSQSLTSYHL